MNVDFWVLFVAAVGGLFLSAHWKYDSDLRKWQHANELIACTKCNRMLKRESMQIDDVEEKPYCRSCVLPHYSVVQPVVDDVGKTLT
jgi:hypothetical protein